MYIQSRCSLYPDTKILHLAPEQGLYSAIRRTVNADGYIGADISQDNFGFVENFRKLDLTSDLELLEDNQFDLVIHSHVLEHVPCNIAYILYHIHRILKQSGKHICVIPFMGGAYEESFAQLSAEEATRRFGQSDHIRRFGTQHLAGALGCIVNIPPTFDAETEFGTGTLDRYNIPASCRKGFQPSTVLCLNKQDYRLLPGNASSLPEESGGTFHCAVQ